MQLIALTNLSHTVYIIMYSCDLEYASYYYSIYTFQNKILHVMSIYTTVEIVQSTDQYKLGEFVIEP